MVSPAGSHIDIVDKTIERIDANARLANEKATEANAALVGLAATAEDEIDLSGIGYALDVGGWDASYRPAEIPIEPTFDDEEPDAPAEITPDGVASFVKGNAPSYAMNLGGHPIGPPAESLTPIPELQALVLPTFTSSVPTADVDALIADYVFDEPEYIPLLKDETLSTLRDVLAGAALLSPAVWDSIWDRAAADIISTQVSDVWMANDLAAGLSMSGMASEALTTRLEAAQQRAIDALAKARHEQAVLEANQRRDDLWQGIAQALATESLWITHHEAMAGRALASAAKAHEALVAGHNANIARFNLIIAQIEAEVASKRLEIEVALVPLQEYASRLDKARIEIAQDDQRVKRWLGEWDGWRTPRQIAAQVLNSEVSGFAATINAEKARLDGDIQYQNLRLAGGAQSITRYQSLWAGIQTKAQSINALYGARIDAARLTIQDQQAKLGFEQMKLSKATEEAMRGPLILLEKAKIQLEQVLGVIERIAELEVGQAQAYLTASDTSLGASAASNVTGSQ